MRRRAHKGRVRPREQQAALQGGSTPPPPPLPCNPPCARLAGLAKAVGSAPLAARLAALRPDLCLVGHTHFGWDAEVEGVRYIQAPLCSPLERRRRLATVGFGASMAAAREDPVAARWLPLEVYKGLVPAGAAAAAAANGGAAVAAAEMAAGDGAAADVAPQVGAQQQQPLAGLQQQQQQQQHPTPGLQQPQQRPQGAWAAQGWQPLRHGAMAPPLRAQWSDHYAQTVRRPDDVAMAPWVAKLYERRQRAAGGGASGGESNGG